MKYLLECNGVGGFVTMERGDSSDYYGAVQRAFQDQAGAAEDRFAFVAMIRMDNPEIVCGVPYTWGLASSAGAWFELLALPGTDRARIERAKAKLRRDQDVVSLSVRRIKRLIEFCAPARVLLQTFNASTP